MTWLKPPPLYWIKTFKLTSEPIKSPLSVSFCNWGKVIVTLTASTSVLVIVLVTSPDTPAVTTTPTAVVDWLLSIPGMWLWLDVPKRGVNSTFWKLKSFNAGLELFALALRIGVSFKNISFYAALL